MKRIAYKTMCMFCAIVDTNRPEVLMNSDKTFK